MMDWPRIIGLAMLVAAPIAAIWSGLSAGLCLVIGLILVSMTME